MIQGTLEEGTSAADEVDGRGARDAAHDRPPAGGARGARGTAAGATSGGASGLWPATRDHVGAVLIRHASPDELEDLQNRAIARRGPSPIPRRAADRELLDSWVGFLSPHFTQGQALNLTGTYSDAYGYSHGLMLPRNVVADFRRFVEAVERRHSPWCLGVEVHPQSQRKILHFHALLGGLWTAAEARCAESFWESSRGFARAKLVTDREGCVEYAAKHLLKQRAEDHFDFHFPCRSRYEYRHRPKPPENGSMKARSAVAGADRQGDISQGVGAG